jgi:hypothetical protein
MLPVFQNHLPLNSLLEILLTCHYFALGEHFQYVLRVHSHYVFPLCTLVENTIIHTWLIFNYNFKQKAHLNKNEADN